MRDNVIRQWANQLKETPLHPQWLIFRRTRQNLVEIGAKAKGRVLDIGAGRQTIRPFLPTNVRYVPLDYYDTAVNWYEFLPEIFGDAQQLPIASASVDTVFLLDVMEHLPRPDACVAEIARVLKVGGRAVIQVPFLYPLHDVPLDFQRWTAFGLTALMQKHGLTVLAQQHMSKPMETAVLLLNLAMTKTVLGWIERKNPLALLGVLLPFYLLLNNLWGWLASWAAPTDDFMPQSYQIYVEKQGEGA